jgi:hypothetical protein
MTKKEIEKLAVQYLRKCEDLLGESKYYDHTPYLSLESSPLADDYDRETIGEFVSDENEIIIYFKNVKSKEELARTIVHEYAHYLQSPIWLTRYNNTHFYDDNPYEFEAFLTEDLYWKLICK